MMVQYATLENDFNIKPSIVVAYIDQTDIGDEICRYKDLRVLDKKNNLIAVKNEFYTRRIFDYTQYYRWSEIILSENTNIVKKLQFTNFFIKFKTLRLINKIKNIKKFGWKNREGNRCPFNKITKYLKDIEKKDLIYFENILKEYVNFLANRDYIDKIIFVTFPHKNHMILESDEDYYSVNVSDIVSKAILNKKKIEHINFTKLMLEKKIKYNPDIYLVNDPASHLKEEYQSKLLLEKIIQEIKNDLINSYKKYLNKVINQKSINAIISNYEKNKRWDELYFAFKKYNQSNIFKKISHRLTKLDPLLVKMFYIEVIKI